MITIGTIRAALARLELIPSESCSDSHRVACQMLGAAARRKRGGFAGGDECATIGLTAAATAHGDAAARSHTAARAHLNMRCASDRQWARRYDPDAAFDQAVAREQALHSVTS